MRVPFWTGPTRSQTRYENALCALFRADSSLPSSGKPPRQRKQIITPDAEHENDFPSMERIIDAHIDADDTGTPLARQLSLPDGVLHDTDRMAVVSPWILNNFHQDQSYNPADGTGSASPPTSPESIVQKPPVHIDNLRYISQTLQIPPSVVNKLTLVYFENMTTVRILHQPSFHDRLFLKLGHEYAAALAAAMFSFSARFMAPWDWLDDPLSGSQSPGNQRRPEYYYDAASNMIQKLIRDLGESSPPLCLLQAFVLTTFYEMVHAARSRAWRSLGACLRLAYELQLHRIDAQPLKHRRQRKLVNSISWVLDEGRRRVWWALWELDVFISTVNKLPVTIRDTHNATLLPVSDEAWFEGRKQQSCFLDADPANRWKLLQGSGNDGGKAWFIVVNSYARDVQAFSHTAISPALGESERKSQVSKTMANLQALANYLSCIELTLPGTLSYDGFRSCRTITVDSRKRMADAHVIHAMAQLTKLYIHHNECFGEEGQISLAGPGTSKTSNGSANRQERPAWRRYMAAADEVVQLVRDSHIDHIRHGHPLLSNTYWIAAAVQILQRVYAATEETRRTAQSNFDLLKLTLIRHQEFWETSSTYITNLSALETRLDPVIEQMQQSRQPRNLSTNPSDGRILPIQSLEQQDSTRLQAFAASAVADGAKRQAQLTSPEVLEDDHPRFDDVSDSGLRNFIDDDPGLQAYIDDIFAGQWNTWGLDFE